MCVKMGESSRGNRSNVQVKNLRCKYLHEYLKTLPLVTLEQLYNHPTTCLAVFRLVNYKLRLKNVFFIFLLL